MVNKQINERFDYSYLRPQKAEMVKNFHKRGFEKRNILKVEKIQDATILPLRKDEKGRVVWGLGGILDSKKQYIEDSGIPKIIDYGYSPEKTVFSEKTVVYCGYFRKHWGEFIAYCLPRLWYVLENDPDVQEYVFFTDENTSFELSGNFKLLIERLGILDRVTIISVPTTYKCVIIPEVSYVQSEYYSNKYINTFDLIHQNINQVNIEKAQKIFLTRSQLKKSASFESGVDMLDNFFSKNGYKVISPEYVTLDEMVGYMDNAEVIACISGTLPHNILFAQGQAQSKQLIIIERNALFNYFQPDTDKILNCNIAYVDANISLYPVLLSNGPFIFAWNDYLSRFADDNNMLAPDDCFLNEANKQKLLKKYMRAYRLEYHMCLYMPSWMQKYTNVIFEAYYDGEEYFSDYLKERKPYKNSQKPPISYVVRLFRKLFKE